MKEAKRKRITPLGWAFCAIMLVALFGGFFLLAPHFEAFFSRMGLASWIGIMIGFFIWYGILMGITLAVWKFGKDKLVRG